MSKHTKGPWKIGTPPPNGEQTIGDARGMMVAVATTGIGMGEETKANARLIAAAPELLDALKGIMNIVSETLGVAGYYPDEDYADWDEFPELQAAEAAIAKAKGE